MKTAQQIIEETKGMYWAFAIDHIVNHCGLETERIQKLPFSQMWAVKNHPEFHCIDVTCQIYNMDRASVTFAFSQHP